MRERERDFLPSLPFFHLTLSVSGIAEIKCRGGGEEVGGAPRPWVYAAYIWDRAA